MTREDALKKRCCGPDGCGQQIRAEHIYPVAHPVSDQFNMPLRFCVAEACMAWRWVEIPYWRDEPGHNERSGYCGLAGGLEHA
jgi:hypothetical protein